MKKQMSKKQMSNAPKAGSAALAALALAALLLAACGKRQDAAARDGVATNGDAPLPRPEASGGSVTGMPDKPGPGQVGPPPPASVLPVDATLTGDATSGVDQGVAPEGTAGTEGEAVPTGPAPDEPTPQDAVAVVRAYYAAIATHGYDRAYALWSDGGRSSGQTLQQFADGFAATAEVAVDVQEPGRIDAAAGSRYIQVPVTVSATQRDGSRHEYRGSYTLRRAVVDGATPEQRAWHIASADIHEVPAGAPPP